ncbi:MAG: hypothetical protein CG445_668, partial [Methanosaeta sp. ASM2]
PPGEDAVQAEEKSSAVLASAQGHSDPLLFGYHASRENGPLHLGLKIVDEMLLAEAGAVML